MKGRVDALDALRGIAILGMAWSGLIPFGALPEWMYHAQSPPPSHVFSPTLFGITWVDLIFPFFLFSMGAAVPLAHRDNERALFSIGKLGLRFIKLVLFSLVVAHIQLAVVMRQESQEPYWSALGAFFTTALVFYKPQGFLKHGWAVPSVLALGIVGSMITSIQFKDGFGPSLARFDVILMVLANVSLTGGLIWLATRNRASVRCLVMLAVAVIFLAADSGGVASEIWKWTPLPGIYQFSYQKYLLIVLPATFIGDALAKRVHESVREVDDQVSASRYIFWTSRFMLAAICLLLLVLVVVGLKARLVTETTFMSFGLICASCLLVYRTNDVLRHAIYWGSALLLIGLLCEPIGGGIRKDSPTLSYFFVGGGLAHFALAMMCILRDSLRRWRSFLADVGANPMLAYVGITNLVPAVAALSGLDRYVFNIHLDPWPRAGIALVEALVVGLVAAACTRGKLFLRA